MCKKEKVFKSLSDAEKNAIFLDERKNPHKKLNKFPGWENDPCNLGYSMMHHFIQLTLRS